MSQYSNKTCYDCGIRLPANEMDRVTESYTSGRSNTTVTAGNLAWAALGDKRGKSAVGRAFKANNRRTYTRNRTVWKCMDCSGTNDYHRSEVRKDINSAIKSIAKAQQGGVFTAPKNLPASVSEKMSALQELNGTTSSRVSQDLRKDIESLIKSAPDADKSKFDKFVDRCDENKAKTKQAWAERRRLSSTEVKIVNFCLTVFEWVCGWFMVAIGVIGAIGQANANELENGIILSLLGFGVALLMRKLKLKKRSKTEEVT